MGWRDRLLGKTAPPRTTTRAPEPRSRWEVIGGQQRRTGRSARDLFAVLRGKRPSSVRVCAEGHQVPDGSTTCAYGHYVG